MMWAVASQRHKSELTNLQHLIDSIPAMIHSGLPDGYPDFFNQRWLNYVGLSLEGLSGWKWTVTIHPEDIAISRPRMQSETATLPTLSKLRRGLRTLFLKVNP